MQQVKQLVSIIVPIFKVERYLQQCIDSICSQTYAQLEILLIDDGSPDRCGKICDSNAMKDSRIKVVHKENGGLSSARNVGIDLARGEYIAFVDADDTIHPKFIEILVELCRQYDCDIAQCDYLVVTEGSVKLPLNPKQSICLYNNRQVIHELSSGNNNVKYSIACNKLYKNKLFDNLRYPLSRIHEDEFTTYLLLWKAKKIVVTNQYLYYYFRRVTSITGKQFSIKRLDALDALRERLDFLKKNNFREEYVDTLKTMLYLIDKYCKLLKSIAECENIYKKLLKEKDRIIEQFPGVLEKKNEQILSDDQIKQNCEYPVKSKVVIYGAGNWGKQFYQWINKTRQGVVVGWVDNRWYAFQDTEYPVSPIDSVLKIEFDYILVAIKNRTVQKEIFENLVFWGVPEKKIFLPSS